MLTTIRTPYGAQALVVLRDVVRDAKRDDPMATVTVVVPNNLAGIVARRYLAAGLSAGGNGVAGLHVATLPRLAEQLGASKLAPRRPATNPVVAAAWRGALDRESSVFDTVKAHPATVRALVQAHRELRDLSEAGLEGVAGASALAADLVRLHRAVEISLAGEWYDQTALLEAATARLEQEPAATHDLGRLVVYLPQALSLAESRFARRLADSVEGTVVLGMTDVDRADRVVRRSLDRMGSPFDEPRGKARVAHEVFHASDSDDEVRCIVRDVVRTLAVTPAHRIAVLYGATQPYGRLLHEHLAAAGITVNGAGTRPVIERAVGRAFLDILLLADADVPRADFFRAVSEAPTRTFSGARVPTSRWERLSRSAAVVKGDDWADRLQTHAGTIEAELDAERGRVDPVPPRIEGLQRDLDTVADFRAFATTLRDRLRVSLTLDTWSALSGWATELFTALYGDARALAQLPLEEQSAAVTVQAVLQGVADLDAVEPTANLRGLIDVLALELEGALPRVGRFGEGVLVAPMSAAIGLEADVVYAMGLAEDSYPGRPAEDALLLETVRAASGGELASYRDRLDNRHRHLLAAFDTAPRVVASFPRGDLRRSTGRLPSRWLLPTLRELAGNRALAATEWETARSDRITGSPSYARSLTNLAMPASEQEWRTRTVAAELPIDDSVVNSGTALVRARAGAAFTRFDGNLAGVEGLPDYADGRRLMSPTALEAMATCPHAYFVERLLRVSPVEQPEEIIAISALDVGLLIHETMDMFVTEQAGSLPGYAEPWTPAHRVRLREIAEAKATDFEVRGSTGHQTLWDSERDRILADLDYMLDNDNERRRVRDSRVLRSELSFGKDGQPPVAITVTDGTVLMRGSADLVEETRDGTLVVIDIKTGGTTRFRKMKTDPIAAGTKLQLPVYAEAAQQLLGGARAEAAYWFVRQGRRDWLPVELTDELRGRYVEAVDTLVASIAGGVFAAKAPDIPDFSWVQCWYCNPDGLGHGEVRTQWERKRLDPALHRLVSLIEPEALDDPEGPEEVGG